MNERGTITISIEYVPSNTSASGIGRSTRTITFSEEEFLNLTIRDRKTLDKRILEILRCYDDIVYRNNTGNNINE